MRKSKTFLVPLYGTKVMMCKDPKIAEKATGEKIPDHSVGSVLGSVVYIEEKHRDYNTISHETYHLARNVAKFVGVDTDDEEAMAYLVGELGDKMLSFYLEEK